MSENQQLLKDLIGVGDKSKSRKMSTSIKFLCLPMMVQIPCLVCPSLVLCLYSWVENHFRGRAVPAPTLVSIAEDSGGGGQLCRMKQVVFRVEEEC